MAMRPLCVDCGCADCAAHVPRTDAVPTRLAEEISIHTRIVGRRYRRSNGVRGGVVARPEMVKRPRANGAASIFPCPTSLKLGRTEVTLSDEPEDGSAGGGDTPGPQTITMRNPCRCGCINGLIITKNGQDTVWCAQCNRYAGYNAPRTETGRPRRSLRTRPKISPSQRARVILRDGCACVKCHRRDELVIGHVVSLRDGYAQGMSDKLLYSDANLVALCAECNSGLGGDSIPPHRLLLIFSLRAQR